MFPKKETWKNGQYWTKNMHGLTPLEKCNSSAFGTSSFDSLERRFFIREYRKTNFPGLYCFKRKNGKMANFRAKPWANPFGKMSIFRPFELVVFIA